MMNAPQIQPRLCRADGQENTRAAALAEIDSHIANLRACVHWLIAAGVAIVDADLKRGRNKPRITCAASPYLYMLFGDDCANVERKRTGGVEVFTWAATRYGCEIRWEEHVKCD